MKKSCFQPEKELRPVIYQLFPRIFANINHACIPNGDITANGCGKLEDINKNILSSIRNLGINYIWYTGIIEHAHDADYTNYGIERNNPHIIKGRAGSPYAITDYYDVDPDLAVNVRERMNEFTSLVERTHEAKMGVIIDFVPNHVGRQYHSDAAPENVENLGAKDRQDYFFFPDNNFFYIPQQQFSPQGVSLGDGKDKYVEFPAKATGNDCFTAFPNKNDWYETIKLNYGIDPWNGNKHFEPIPNTWHKMLDILMFWAGKDIDGFRCDMAHMVPVEFWKWAIHNVKKKYPKIIFIAELYNPGIYRDYLFNAGFDYLYDKVNLYDTLRGIETGYFSAARLTTCWQTTDGIADKMLNFLENHDEQRFASDFYAQEAEKVVPSLVAIVTLSKGAIMIYNGQELGEKGMDAEGFSGVDGRTTIFDYWSMETIRRWLSNRYCPSLEKLSEKERELRWLYSLILKMANGIEAFRVGKFFDLMYVNYHSDGLNPNKHFVYLRSSDDETAIIFLNFDDTQAKAKVLIPQHAFDVLQLPQGKLYAKNLLTGDISNIKLYPEQALNMEVRPHYAAILLITHPKKKS